MLPIEKIRYQEEKKKTTSIAFRIRCDMYSCFNPKVNDSIWIRIKENLFSWTFIYFMWLCFSCTCGDY